MQARRAGRAHADAVDDAPGQAVVDLGCGEQHRYGAEPFDQLCAELAGRRDLEAGQVSHLAHRFLGGIELLQAAHVQGQHFRALEFAGRCEVSNVGAPQGDGY